VLAKEPIFRHKLIAIAPSWHCNSLCRHCFIQKNIRQRDTYTPAVVDAVLSDLPETVAAIGITGGEPFLHPRRLLRLVQRISQRGRTCGVVTNAQWTLNSERANRIISDLRQAGLGGIAISIDDYHVPSIPIENAVWLIRRAHELGLSVEIKGVGHRAVSAINQCISNNELKTMVDSVETFTLENIGEGAFLPRDRVGPYNQNACPMALAAEVFPNGEVNACCSPYMFECHNRILTLGNVLKTPLSVILERAERSYLLAAVISRGAAGVMKIAGIKVSPKEKDLHPCQLCVRALSDPEVVSKVTKRIAGDLELRKELVGKTMLRAQHYYGRRSIVG
jgi:MoaA/NifB/PqqE/SkfB family radical SAM enzyme